ncbi:MAG: hypothetical protein FWF51_11955 [Chitinivibrionia bacterium]|nr:hypothetical protein [Chitinivibrionia bacterium]
MYIQKYYKENNTQYTNKYHSPLGDITMASNGEALTGLWFDRQKYFGDCLHIACAIVSGCDVIVSWNFKHIVNYKTHMGVKAVTALEGYKELLIYTPAMLLGYDDDK